ncbi:ribosomal protein L32 [Macrophomina phaseolina MS6]|uniref:Ribosomal protein L32 n=1 Tax=Macrophomina phaseolina (strain MS6) TaxID=1126212 RepID=K2QNF8_MACPH|nr:ribosomal protein L32 [Macrophomina phaseolina MS6]
MAHSDVDDLDFCDAEESDDAFSFCEVPAPLRYKVMKLRLESRLLKLPREIRNQIYHHALVEPPCYLKLHDPLCSWNPNPEDLDARLPHSILMPHDSMIQELDRPSACPCKCPRRTALNLRRACRQIYIESTPIFYENNVFCFDKPEDLSRWIRFLPPKHRSLIRHICALRDTSRGEVAPYRDIHLLTGLRTLDIDFYLSPDDFGPTRDDARANLNQLPHLRRVRIIKPFSHNFRQRQLADPAAPHLGALYYAKIPVWEVHTVDKPSDPDWLTKEHERMQSVRADPTTSTARSEHFLRAHNLRRPTDPYEWHRPIRVPLKNRDDFEELLCFNVPLAPAVEERLERRERRAAIKTDLMWSARLRDEYAAEARAEKRAERAGRMEEMEEKRERERKEEVVRLQPHKKWHAEMRSRKAGIAKGKGRAARLQMEDEVEWAREDWDACAREDWS